jgi:geranylgeranyl diphosphate synthase type II
VYGDAIALLSGDAMNMKAYEIASGNKSASLESRIKAVSVISRLSGGEGMLGGQQIDHDCEDKKVDFETLLNMHSKKTAALIKASALLGCCSAEINDEEDERAINAVKYASSIGLAFQIKDDILDVEGDEKLLGKAVHADAKMEKTTFLSFMSLDEAKEYAEKETKKAVDCIKQYEGSETLIELAYWLLNRNK